MRKDTKSAQLIAVCKGTVSSQTCQPSQPLKSCHHPSSLFIYSLQMSFSFLSFSNVFNFFIHCWDIRQCLRHHLQCLLRSFKDSNKLFCSKRGHQWRCSLLYNLYPCNLDHQIRTKRLGSYNLSETVLLCRSNQSNKCTTFYFNSQCYSCG